MTLRRRTPFVLVVLACAIAACSSNGEPSWSLTSSTSAGGFHGPQVEDLTGMVIDWEFAEDVDSWGDVPDDFEWGLRQRNPQSIEVGWWGSDVTTTRGWLSTRMFWRPTGP